MTKTLLFDRDNLRETFAGWKGKELLQKHGFSSLKELYATLIAEKANGAEYVIGLPGVGKSTFAMKQFDAKAIETKEDIQNLLSLDFDKMVFVSCDVEDEIAEKAGHITLLHAHPERLKYQRKMRDEEIEDGTSETGFGRNAGSTAFVTTNDDVLISRLKTDYEEKSDLLLYRSKDPTDFEKMKKIAVKSGISEEKKYVQKGIVQSSGKFAPIHTIHEMMLRQGADLAREKDIPFCITMVRNSGGEFDFALSWSEKKKLLELALDDVKPVVVENTPEFLRFSSKEIVKVDRDQSFVFLGKERLPAGFTEGTTEEIFTNPKYTDFLKSPDSYAVHKCKGAYFFNVGTIAMEGSEESVSATFIRKNLIEGNVEALRPYLSEKVLEVLTMPENLAAIARRAKIVAERDEKVRLLKETFDQQYKSHHPITKEPLMKRDGTPKLLTKAVITTKTSAKDKERILRYLEAKDAMFKRHKSGLVAKYREQLGKEENRLKM